ncbi:MAG: response regulator [Deltaproteobacteria bacterium]|nr:response regulator [Deltaproteobacteria bacterium]MBW1918714.1 response regulator [Deltaproteobacteria bacterium]MBW1934501.1 response regulator [Deltaproteobacteria bacterium]MBW1977119.1 response regulator [Deltaproteobacteria bacterium]MBW2044597.1 response regulator [Deltaproteobacteria bacterium]
MAGMKVLLVDDEQEFVTTLGERLKLRGIDTDIAMGGEAALEIIETSVPDAVVLDVMMPGLSGLDVLERIKADRPDLPVILLTGHGGTQEGIKGMRLGASDYLMKPLDIDELIKKLHEAVRGAL